MIATLMKRQACESLDLLGQMRKMSIRNSSQEVRMLQRQRERTAGTVPTTLML